MRHSDFGLLSSLGIFSFSFAILGHAGTTNMGNTFVGFGFGPIQSALFALEAHRSGNFSRLVVTEVVPGVVRAFRSAGGCCRVNIAGDRAVETLELSGLEIYNPLEAEDRRNLEAAIAEASEIAMALPSVEFFSRGKPSPAEVLAAGLARRITSDSVSQTIVYAAENHHEAAQLLRAAVADRLDPRLNEALGRRVQFLNTVIGKMSGTVSDPAEIAGQALAPLVDGSDRAFLVEQFNRILITRITLPGFQRGIEVFDEKDDLVPFEEAKLYGHNATHALIGYLAQRRGYRDVLSSDIVRIDFVYFRSRCFR